MKKEYNTKLTFHIISKKINKKNSTLNKNRLVQVNSHHYDIQTKKQNVYSKKPIQPYQPRVYPKRHVGRNVKRIDGN